MIQVQPHLQAQVRFIETRMPTTTGVVQGGVRRRHAMRRKYQVLPPQQKVVIYMVGIIPHLVGPEPRLLVTPVLYQQRMHQRPMQQFMPNGRPAVRARHIL